MIGVSLCLFAAYEFLQIYVLTEAEELALMELTNGTYLILYPFVDITSDLILHFLPHLDHFYTPPSLEISSLVMDVNCEAMIDIIRQKRSYHRREPISPYLPHTLINNTMHQMLSFNICGPMEWVPRTRLFLKLSLHYVQTFSDLKHLTKCLTLFNNELDTILVEFSDTSTTMERRQYLARYAHFRSYIFVYKLFMHIMLH